MAKVWFVRPQNRLVALGDRPAYEGELEQLIWSLDIGLHRYHTAEPLAQSGEAPPTEFSPHDQVMVEVTPGDIKPGTNYRVGFYSSPYSPKAAITRLGQPYRS
ncbi:MAG: hypothetical protein AB7G75_17255 [Candidatus Binatia bacterium]